VWCLQEPGLAIYYVKKRSCEECYMAETTATIIPKDSPESFSDRKPTSSPSVWHRLALAGVMLVSLWMNFYQLGQNGFGNLFYAAGVRSMVDSWHNFFFVSYDPGGFVTIDKPALGFWLQALSAKLFGFTPFSIFFPQAIAGVLAVVLLYALVRRYFGINAGLLAALFLAISPISVVTNRNNTIDSTLALVLLLGAWAVLRAAESGQLRWLLLSGVFIGLGFNVKMTEAYLVIPAFGLLYLLAAPKKLWIRIVHLVLALLVMVIVSFSWAVAVDLTPASQRPYVGSSQTNSEINLATGYNGLNRLKIGNNGGRNGQQRTRDTTRTATTSTTPGATGTTRTATTNTTPGATGTTPGNTAGGFTGQPGGGFGNGAANAEGAPQINAFGGGGGNNSIFRLFNNQLGGQVGWLLPLALFGMLALIVLRRFRFQQDFQQQSLLLWGMWVLTMGIFFSLTSIAHVYYLTEMAPGVAAMAGIGVVLMWRYYRLSDWRGWLLPLALVATAADQIYILKSYPQWSWLIPMIAVVVGVVTLALVLGRLLPQLKRPEISSRYLMPIIGVGLLALLFAPTIWAALPVLANQENSSPTAGPTGRQDVGGRQSTGRQGTTAAPQAGGFAQGGFGGESATANPALIQYLEANQGSTKFLVATASSMNADGIILSTNKPVMAMGGFGGGDPIITTTEQLQTLISNGTIRFFLLTAPRTTTTATGSGANTPARQGFNFFGGGRQNVVSTWVTQHCKSVPASTVEAAASGTNGASNPFGSNTLYDCSVTK
jgi:4-amino-4-deoxy-L-arabinose transferase-like glycosyltransferase